MANHLTAENLAAMMAATAAPPGVGKDNKEGQAAQYARADHTHATSVQRRIITIQSGGTATWEFTKAYAVPPVVTYGIENVTGAPLPYVVNIVSAPSATSVTFQAYKAKTTTLGSSLAALLGAIVSPFEPAPANLKLHCWAALPTE